MRTSVVDKKSIKEIILVSDSLNTPLLYIVNYVNNSGWIIVSATKKYHPIVAFSDEGYFDKDIASPANMWIGMIAKDILTKKNNDSIQIVPEWIKYEEKLPLSMSKGSIPSYQNIDWWRDETMHDITNTNKYPPKQGDYSSYGTFISDMFCSLVELSSYIPSYDGDYMNISNRMESMGWSDDAPLVHMKHFYKKIIINKMIETYWEQSEPFNQSIPDEKLVGCVPVAIGQIMNYHKWPSDYANWGEMGKEDKLEEATLLKKIGDGIGMIYGKKQSYPNFWKNLPNFSDLTGIEKFFKRNNYSVSSGSVKDNLHIIRNALIEGKPVYMEGTGKCFSLLGITVPNFKAHAWVCDGITYSKTTYFLEYLYLPQYPNPGTSQDTPLETNPYDREYNMFGESAHSYSYFHMNWGWGKHSKHNNDDGSYLSKNGWYLDANISNAGLKYEVWFKYVIPSPNRKK